MYVPIAERVDTRSRIVGRRRGTPKVCSLCRKKGQEEADCWERNQEQQNVGVGDNEEPQQLTVMQESESGSETEVEPEIFTAVRRTREGGPLPRQRDLRGNSKQPVDMRIENLVDPPMQHNRMSHRQIRGWKNAKRRKGRLPRLQVRNWWRVG